MWVKDGRESSETNRNIINRSACDIGGGRMVINAMWFDDDELKEKLIDVEDLKLFGEIPEEEEK